MKIIVTGSRGFIGQHLVKELRGRDHDIYEIDRKVGLDVCACPLPYADRVYHLAAQTDAYSTRAGDDAITNIIGLLRILERYRDKVVFTSSAMAEHPQTPYGISKHAGELYARLYGAAIVRLPNVYGSGGHSFIDKCRENEVIEIFGDGKQTRSWLYVDTAVDEILRAEPGQISKPRGAMSRIIDVARAYAKPIEFRPARPNDIERVVQ